MNVDLHDSVNRLFEFMQERKAFHALDEHTRSMLDRALEKVIDGTDDRIRMVPNYQRKLFKSILKALEYADSLVEQIPHPINLNSRRFVSDPYIRAMFPTLDRFKKVCLQSSELREFFEEPGHRKSAEGTALLCMHKHEDTVFGMELEGNHVIRDVCQQRVTFEDHHLYSPAEDENSTRRGLKCCIFEGLVNNALANISRLRLRRRELETQQQILHARIRNHSRLGTTSPDFQRLVLEQNCLDKERDKLQKVEKELHEIGYLTPESCLQHVNATLSHPDDFIRLKNYSYRLDTDNIMRSNKDTSHKTSHLNFSEVRIKGEQPRVVTLARINRSDVTNIEQRTVSFI